MDNIEPEHLPTTSVTQGQMAAKRSGANEPADVRVEKWREGNKTFYLFFNPEVNSPIAGFLAVLQRDHVDAPEIEHGAYARANFLLIPHPGHGYESTLHHWAQDTKMRLQMDTSCGFDGEYVNKLRNHGMIADPRPLQVGWYSDVYKLNPHFPDWKQAQYEHLEIFKTMMDALRDDAILSPDVNTREAFMQKIFNTLGRMPTIQEESISGKTSLSGKTSFSLY